MSALRTQRRPRTLLRRVSGRVYRIVTRTQYVSPEVSDVERGHICDQERAAASRRDYRTGVPA